MTVSESIVIKVEEWELERLSCFVTFSNLVIALIKRKKKKKSHMGGGGGGGVFGMGSRGRLWGHRYKSLSASNEWDFNLIKSSYRRKKKKRNCFITLSKHNLKTTSHGYYVCM